VGGAGEAQTVSLEIVGIAQESLMGVGFEPTNYFLEGTLPDGLPPGMMTIVANIAPEAISDVRQALAGTLGVFVIENAAITRLINSLLGTFTAFPTMVATLGLIVGGVVIANSVALTTMERRREIAVMKAVGLQRYRVLLMLLLENALLGLVGGLVGIGMGLIGVVLFASASGAPSTTVPYGTALLLMLLCVVVAVIAALSSAWGAAGEKPLNVLRYE
jgi:putative ABC transport system permease protein